MFKFFVSFLQTCCFKWIHTFSSVPPPPMIQLIWRSSMNGCLFGHDKFPTDKGRYAPPSRLWHSQEYKGKSITETVIHQRWKPCFRLCRHTLLNRPKTCLINKTEQRELDPAASQKLKLKCQLPCFWLSPLYIPTPAQVLLVIFVGLSNVLFSTWKAMEKYFCIC